MRFKQWNRHGWAAALLCCTLATLAGRVHAADAVQASEFVWRGTLNLPAGASLVRVDLPVQAMLRMQSSTANDVRVFNAAGAVVPFALQGGVALSRAAPLAHTVAYKAYSLFAASAADKPLRGAVSVRVDGAGPHSSAWVHWDAQPTTSASGAAAAEPLQAALFDLRQEKQAVDALELTLSLPHNALVPITVATSTDLKEWTEVPTRGPLFQFDGADAPANTTLELHQPLPVQGRYLRLAWAGQSGVKLVSLTGRVASGPTALVPLRAALPPGLADGNNSLSWNLPFGAPIAAVHVQAVRDNTLVPVRIQGRSEASQPWRTVANAVVYRLDTVGRGSSNPSTALHGASLRALRVETSQGMALPEGGLQASVEFAPVQVVFLASGTGPFTLAVGRAQTAAAAVDASLLGSVSSARLGDLPLATIGNVQEQGDGALAGMAPSWLPAGVSLRTLLLWSVLGVGVLALGAVAYSLMRQISSKKDTTLQG